MKVLFDIVHPADVLFFYHSIQTLENSGHQVVIASRDKDITLELLQALSLDNQSLSKASSGIVGLAIELISRDWNMLKLAKQSKPDVMIGFGGISISHVGKLLGIPSISFYDTETAPLQHMVTLPFITEMHVPDCYTGKIAKNRTFRFKGQKDFSYLHPENFKVDKDLATDAGYVEGIPNFFLRVVAWNANHDIGNSGWDLDTLKAFIEHLSKKGKVHVSSELPLPNELKQHQYKGKVHHIHHLLACCDAYIGESATMAGEAILVGTPAICAANIKLGYTDELARQELLWNVTEVNFTSLVRAFESLSKSVELDWHTKQKTYLSDKPNLSNTVTQSILKYAK
jgi:predicted glycosyltransferase